MLPAPLTKAERTALFKSQNQAAATDAAKLAKETQKAEEKLSEANAKAAELLSVETRAAFADDRLELMSSFEASGISLDGLEPEALAAFAAIAAGLEYEEDDTVSRGALILREAGVGHADLAFPAPAGVEVATTLRNMLKKVRAKLRSAVAELLKNAKAPKGVNPGKKFEALMTGTIAAESSFSYTPTEKMVTKKEETVKEKGTKAKKDDAEDLDSILAEFGVVVDNASTKKKKKAGKK